MKKASEIRKDFLRYFKQKNHTVVESSSLIPVKDPTLLFTNAGMVQFKKVFLGEEERSFKRAASSQKCVRAGGKHNDLENVGRTARHHTFFEMLGNFSFGDYFKEEAILMAWEFMTRFLRIPQEKLWVTVFKEDEDASTIWRDRIGMPANRIVPMGAKDNFWAMGETGPCGPCSEILIDQGVDCGCGREDCRVGCDCDRFLELWNLVFMQFNRDDSGAMHPLPKPSIDTGMGLERITAVVQRVKSNYDTDLFGPLINFVERIAGKAYGEDPTSDISIRVIADHSRAIAFLIADGILPSNEGRGYVLRRIMRRAARHGKKLGLTKKFLYEAIHVVAKEMQDAYPEILRSQEYISRVVVNEEENFAATLDTGLKILQEEIDILRTKKCHTIPGEVVFKLYDTYGFPIDLTADIASEHAMQIDEDGFHRTMDVQRQRARQSWKGSADEKVADIYKKISQEGLQVAFKGYETIRIRSSVLWIIQNGKTAASAREGETVEIVTPETCFYAEAGGQVGDVGIISHQDGVIEISDVCKPLPELIVHRGTVKQGAVQQGDAVELLVDARRRQSTANNHTATHILHYVLKQLLGGHVKQAGSLVAPDRLRFDFTHFEPLPEKDLAAIEELVNERIREDLSVTTRVLPLKEAIDLGAVALFGEKYADMARVVSIADYSMELCGGTHTRSTGQLGIFKIVSEAGVAAGVRRLEALTGKGACQFIKKEEDILRSLYHTLKTDRDGILNKIERLLGEHKDLAKEIQALKSQVVAGQTGSMLGETREIAGVKVVVTTVQEEDPKSLRDFGDKMRDRLGSGVIVVGSQQAGKAHLLAMVTDDISGRFSAKKIIEEIAPIVDGRGGGREIMAQAGGKNPRKLAQALEKAWHIIEAMGQKN